MNFHLWRRALFPDLNSIRPGGGGIAHPGQPAGLSPGCSRPVMALCQWQGRLSPSHESVIFRNGSRNSHLNADTLSSLSVAEGPHARRARCPLSQEMRRCRDQRGDSAKHFFFFSKVAAPSARLVCHGKQTVVGIQCFVFIATEILFTASVK